jgi:hypothetical protein
MSKILGMSIAQQLERLCQFRNPEDVWHFLEMHQYLIAVSNEVHASARKPSSPPAPPR